VAQGEGPEFKSQYCTIINKYVNERCLWEGLEEGIIDLPAVCVALDPGEQL
jgi:hypothetical protein